MNREDTLLDLFLHPGWKIVQEEMGEALEAFKATSYMVTTIEGLYHRKGQIEQLERICNYETIIKSQVDENNEPDAVGF